MHKAPWHVRRYRRNNTFVISAILFHGPTVKYANQRNGANLVRAVRKAAAPPRFDSVRGDQLRSCDQSRQKERRTPPVAASGLRASRKGGVAGALSGRKNVQAQAWQSEDLEGVAATLAPTHLSPLSPRVDNRPPPVYRRCAACTSTSSASRNSSTMTTRAE